jgi:hypothetical protein
MSTIPPESHAQSPRTNEAGRIRYVEALAGPEDTWISITDAARITRTSEAMARRWVTTGRLPIKREPVGLNQRTRLVRVSDVATIRPIVDATAAITDEVHKLDLLSIPQQQAQIQQDHQRITTIIQQGQQTLQELHMQLQEVGVQHQQSFEELRQQLLGQQAEERREHLRLQRQHEQVMEHTQQQADAIVLVHHQLDEQWRECQQTLKALQTTLTEQFEQVQHEHEQQFLEFEQRQHQQAEEVKSNALQYFQQQEQIRDKLKAMETTVAQLVEETQQLHQQNVSQQEALVLQGKKLTKSLQERTDEISMTIEQHWAVQTREKLALEKRLENVEQLLKQQTGQSYGQRLAEQERVIETLTAQLHEERHARQVLHEQFIQQQEDLQVLHRELELVHRQIAASQE